VDSSPPVERPKQLSALIFMRHTPAGPPLDLPYPDPDPVDVAAVVALIGKQPRTSFEVVVRAADGCPVVLRNAPLEFDGTPMPTRYWLIGPNEIALVGHIEAGGGVKRAEAAIDSDAIADAHARYAAERDAALPPNWAGRRPTGGVGGTRRGLKCLHAHYAWYLAGGDDPVGVWVAEQLAVSSAVEGNGRP
jgi:uncharacterized protein